MLAGARNFAKSWPAKILMGLLAVSFIGWGVNRTSGSFVAGDQVVKVGSRSINSLEFKTEYDGYKKRLEQQNGRPISNEEAEKGNLDAIVLNGVATREAMSELMARVGIKPGDKLILDQIEKIPAFFDPISGRFDKKIFRQRLGENGMTPERFDAVLRDEMATQHWGVAMQNGLVAPRSYGALASVFSLEARDLAYVSLSPDSVPKPAEPTDAQLQAFMNENKAALTLPEMRVLTVVPFTPQAAAAKMANAPVDPAELKKRYDFRKDTLSKPEVRTVVQIPAKDAATAQKITAALRAGQAPEAVAKSVGVDAVTFPDRPLSAISDRKVGAAAFKMQAGEVATVQGDLGAAVVKVVSVTPGREVSLEEARPMLEAEIRKDMLAEKVYAQTQAYDDAHQGGSSLADSAQKAGVAATTIGPITAQGVNEQGAQLQGLPPKILETAFALPAGGESEITELGDGAYFAVRVERILPAHMPPLAEVRPMIAREYVQREVIKALEAKAESIRARVAKGETLEAASGLSVSRLPGLTRQTAGAHQDLGREVLGRTFAAKQGEPWIARAPNALVIGRVEGVHTDSGPTAARLAEENRGALAQAIAREMGEAAQVYARTKLKAKLDPARARAAVGFEPLAETKGGEKAAEKKK
ncbi:peptidylprolyl isomerase [Phenylobacterium sp.]|uniref:peptidylprolyl isomerase n=1 Tax=Phenylobacterium sp. TaxID=1871053 RepID=UPI0025F87D33|nr:peptidylprolyl isomerase [Phenylobacterium sp.]